MNIKRRQAAADPQT